MKRMEQSMRQILWIGILSILLHFFSIPAMAARPYVTDDAGTVGLGLFELETASNCWKDRVEFGLCFKHGITDRMEIGVAMGHCASPKDERAIQDAELGFKFALIPDLFAASFTGVSGTLARRNGIHDGLLDGCPENREITNSQPEIGTDIFENSPSRQQAKKRPEHFAVYLG
jgi:hypothetical protein